MTLTHHAVALRLRKLLYPAAPFGVAVFWGLWAGFLRVYFDYHLGLHYSQTDGHRRVRWHEFDYHLGLHYSQTVPSTCDIDKPFDYHLGLHYSQTRSRSGLRW